MKCLCLVLLTLSMLIKKTFEGFEVKLINAPEVQLHCSSLRQSGVKLIDGTYKKKVYTNTSTKKKVVLESLLEKLKPRALEEMRLKIDKTTEISALFSNYSVF